MFVPLGRLDKLGKVLHVGMELNFRRKAKCYPVRRLPGY